MPNRFWWAAFFLIGIMFLDQVVFAEMTLFDFNQAPTSARRQANNYLAVESYMEGLFGSDITVSQGTTAVTGMGILGSSDAFLLNGKGRNSGLVLSFDSAPINSFAVDWGVLRKGTGIVIKADGVVIFQDLLTKAEKKTGIMDHFSPIYFDSPVHTLEFLGVGKSRIGIDNLAVNIALPYNGDVDSPIANSENGAGNGSPKSDPADSGNGVGATDNSSYGNGDSSTTLTETGTPPNGDNGYPGDWNGYYDDAGPSGRDPQAVPEPQAILLLGVGLLALIAGRGLMRPARERSARMFND